MSVEAAFAARVRAARLARGMTQADLAGKVSAGGIVWYQSTVNKVETGRRAIFLEEAVALSALLEVDLVDSDDVVTRPLDVGALANLVRVGMAAYGALVVPSTSAVERMRRDRVLRAGAAFLADVEGSE